MGRPLKTDTERRDFTFRVRANAAEKTRIEQNAIDAGQEPSVYLRSRGTGDRPTRTVPTTDREILLKVLAEAGKQGSNLNQIARAINRRHDNVELIDVDLRQLTITLKGIDELKTLLMEMLRI